MALRSEVRRYVMRHLSYPLEVAFWNTSRFAGLEGFDAERPVAPEIGVSARVSDLHLVYFYVLSLLALAGMLLGAYRGRPWILWGLPATLVLSFVFVLSVNTRYHVAIDAMLVLPAAFALRAAAARIRR